MTKTEIEDRSGGLFDYLRTRYKLPTDSQLAEFIGTTSSVVSEIRHGKRFVNDHLLVRICLASNLSLKKAMALIAHRSG